MTSHPKAFTDAVIDAIAACDKVCNYIHLPIQSGSTRVLKAMNRKYTQEDILDRVSRPEKIPGVAITTDLIVGFPVKPKKTLRKPSKLLSSVSLIQPLPFVFDPHRHPSRYDG